MFRNHVSARHISPHTSQLTILCSYESRKAALKVYKIAFTATDDRNSCIYVNPAIDTLIIHVKAAIGINDFIFHQRFDAEEVKYCYPPDVRNSGPFSGILDSGFGRIWNAWSLQAQWTWIFTTVKAWIPGGPGRRTPSGHIIPMVVGMGSCCRRSWWAHSQNCSCGSSARLTRRGGNGAQRGGELLVNCWPMKRRKLGVILSLMLVGLWAAIRCLQKKRIHLLLFSLGSESKVAKFPHCLSCWQSSPGNS